MGAETRQLIISTAAHLWPELDPSDFDIVIVYDGGYRAILTTGKKTGDTRVLVRSYMGRPDSPLDDLMRLLARQYQPEHGRTHTLHWYSEFRPGTDQVAKSKALETQDEPPSYSSIGRSKEDEQGSSSKAC